VTTELWTAAAVGIVAGWLLKMAWEWLLDWLHDAAADAGDMLRDVLALAGIVAVVYAVYQAST
jgi:hypothetical protein